jgi:hypothetical protein
MMDGSVALEEELVELHPSTALELENDLNDERIKFTIFDYLRSMRFRVMMLLWMSEILCFLDRTNISVGIIAMSDEYNSLKDPENKGEVIS